jgi:MFS family permease
VIQGHVLGMFAPSFVTGHLIARYGAINVMTAGAVLLAGAIATSLSGIEFMNFLVGMTLVGVGWNFLFIGGTTLLTETYRVEEKAKVQAFNDFTVFTVVTAASFSAGALQHQFGWEVVNIGVLPPILVVLAAVLWLKARSRAVADVREAS